VSQNGSVNDGANHIYLIIEYSDTSREVPVIIRKFSACGFRGCPGLILSKGEKGVGWGARSRIHTIYLPPTTTVSSYTWVQPAEPVRGGGD
jgi:hypothetical protein